MFSRVFPLAASLALFMTLFSVDPAVVHAEQAEQAEVEEEVMDRIRVVAPRVTRTPERRGRYQVELVERSDYVDYGDLDLTRTADMFELEERVHEIATEVCTLLAEMFPRGSPSTETCIRRAVEDARPLVEAAVRAAIAE